MGAEVSWWRVDGGYRCSCLGGVRRHGARGRRRGGASKKRPSLEVETQIWFLSSIFCSFLFDRRTCTMSQARLYILSHFQIRSTLSSSLRRGREGTNRVDDTISSRDRQWRKKRDRGKRGAGGMNSAIKKICELYSVVQQFL